MLLSFASLLLLSVDSLDVDSLDVLSLLSLSFSSPFDEDDDEDEVLALESLEYHPDPLKMMPAGTNTFLTLA